MKLAEFFQEVPNIGLPGLELQPLYHGIASRVQLKLVPGIRSRSLVWTVPAFPYIVDTCEKAVRMLDVHLTCSQV